MIVLNKLWFVQTMLSANEGINTARFIIQRSLLYARSMRQLFYIYHDGTGV